MRRRAATRAGAWVLAALLVPAAGCQRTLFAEPPAAATGCEPLVGHWQSTADAQGREGEVEAFVSADCSVRLVEHAARGTREYPPLQLHASAGAAQRWLWVDASEANRALSVEAGSLDRAGTVYAFGWTLQGDMLVVVPPAHRHLAHGVVDGGLRGAVHAEDRALTVRIDEDAAAIARLLAAEGLDADKAFRFRRAPEPSS